VIDRQRSDKRVSIGLIMLFQVAALLVRSFAQQGLKTGGTDAMIAKHLSALIGFALLCFLMWPLVAAHSSQIRGYFRRPHSWLRLTLSSVAIGLILRAMRWASMFAAIFFGIYGPGDAELAVGAAFWWACPPAATLTLSLIVMALLTPVIEEVINRGVILGALVDRGRWPAIVLSAILFTILHRIDSMPAAFVFGLVAALQMLHYRTLWGCIVAHATYNLSAILDWNCLHGRWTPATTSLPMGLGSLLIAALLLTLAIWLARQHSAGAHAAPRH